MELILKKDVENLGFVDDIVTVRNGYGRNYLIPKGYAVMATPSAKKMLAETLKQRAFKEESVIKEAKTKATELQEVELKITAKAGKDDKLFGSVSNADVSEALAKAGVEVDKKYISVYGGLIKRVGPYEAQIRLHREVVVEFPFEVIPEVQA